VSATDAQVDPARAALLARRAEVSRELSSFQESGDFLKDKAYREWLRWELKIINARIQRAEAG
jgi:hypothetical protein